jgi:hypothetical protein
MIRIWLRAISELLHDTIRMLMLMRSASSWNPREKSRRPLDFDER